MTFTSFEFLVFFLAVLLVRTLFRNRTGANWLLLAASVCFYLSWSIPCILLILLTAVVDYSIGARLARTDNQVLRKRLLIISLALNVGILGFFKYANFFVGNICGGLNGIGVHVAPVHLDIILPPAISYFTFASMSYVLDVYYERLPACDNLREYALFITFFPKLLAGPIVRAREFLPQLQQRASASAQDVEIGMARFLVGAVKKLVIADQVAGNVNLIFASPSQYDGFTLLQGLLGYAVQVYCDFSGYSDMAIGSARILGYRFPENFQMPFSAVTISEFWRRWHISLSNWLRDYVFMPMEIITRDFRYPSLRVSFNLIVTMLICGLWHGASWGFVFWGGLQGLALATHKAWSTWNPLASLPKTGPARFAWNTFSRVLTLGSVLLAWVFLRADTFSNAVHYIGHMLTWSNAGTHLVSPYILAAVICVFLTHLFVRKDRMWVEEVATMPVPARVFAYSALLLFLTFFAATNGAPFIYFQF
jgi:alginate O-acetyltransferase complex protein AlgI